MRFPTVYVAKAVGLDVYKIGRSSGVFTRLSTLDRGTPFGIELIALIRTIDAEELERFLHRIVKGPRVHGEWFQLTEEDLQTIKGIANVENKTWLALIT